MKNSTIKSKRVLFNFKSVLLVVTTMMIASVSQAKIWYVNDASTTGDVFTTAIGAAGNSGTAASPFLTIAAAITAASSRDSIFVDAGTYNASVTISKNLYFRGAKFGIPAGPAATPLNRGTNESIIVGSVLFGASRDSITVDGFTVNAGGSARGIEARGLNSVVINNIVTGILNIGIIQQGITARANSPVREHSYLISNNNVSGFRYGIFFDGNDKSISTNGLGTLPSTISYNYVTGSTTAAVTVVNSPGHLIKANVIENNGQGMTFTYGNNRIIENTIRNQQFGFGIRLEGFATNHDNIILNNYIQNNSVAISLTNPTGGPFAGTVNNEAHYNYIVGNSTDITNAHLNNFNATCNWYNSIDPAVIATKISTNVTFIPFLVTSVDTNPLLDGFQPAPLCSLVNCTIAVTANSTNTCPGASSGSVTATVTGAANPTYLWSPGGQTSQTVNGLPAGDYIVTVTEGTCSVSDTVTVSQSELPVCSVSGADSVCTANSFTYDAPSDMDSYSWIAGSGAVIDGSATSSSVLIITPSVCGGFTLNLTVTKNGCSSTCAKQFTVFDTTKPVFTYCPPAVDLGCNPTVMPEPDQTAEARDNCGLVTVTSAMGSIFSNGCGQLRNAQGRSTGECCIKSQTITYTATDACGNTATCTQLFTWKVDTEKPEIIINDVPDVNCNPTQAELEAGFSLATVTDNCSLNLVPNVTTDPVIWLGGCTYSITRIWTVEDECGNKDTATQSIEFTRDTVKPVIDIASPGTLSCNPTASQINAAFGVASATDNCSGILVPTGTVEPETGSGCNYTVTKIWTVTDDCGNVSTASQTLSFVRDTVKPVVVIGPPIRLSCSPTQDEINAAFGFTTATDNCSNNLIPSGTVGPVIQNGCEFSATITCTATDDCGNVGVAYQTVYFFRDTDKPVINLTPASSLGCNPTSAQIEAAFGTASVTDVCTPNLTATGVIGTETGQGCNYSVTKTWTVTDSCNNTATATQTINYIRDTVKPDITLSNSGTLSCNPTAAQVEAAFGTATVDDNCSNALTATGTFDSEVSTDCTFSLTKNWTVTDACGNTGTASQTVTYRRDTIKPVISLDPATQLGCNPTASMIAAAFGSAYVDNEYCNENLLVDKYLGNEVSEGGCVFSVTKYWSVTDECGNTGTATQTIRFNRDTVKPVISLTPDALLSCNPTRAAVEAAFGDATVTDNCGDNLVASGEVGVEAGQGCNFSITKTWTVTDACGNTGTASQTIYFTRDTTKPVITLTPAGMLSCNPAASEIENAFGSASVEDNCSNGLIATGVIGSPSATNCGTTISKTWTVTDNCGNTATEIQTLTYVTNSTAPSPDHIPSDYRASCNTAYNNLMWDNVVFTDNCTGTVLTAVNVTTTRTTGTDCDSVFTRTWTATNSCGISGSVTQKITVKYDSQKPVITLTAAGILGCNPTPAQIAAAFGTASVTENCSTGLTASGVLTAEAGQGCNRSVTKNWTVTDGCGNVGTASQTITFNRDTTKPVINCLPNKTSGCNQPVVFDTPAYSDNCDQQPVLMVVSTVTNGNIQTRTWKVTDACGNFSTCSQSITAGGGGQMTMGLCSHTDVTCHSSCNNAGSTSGSVKAGVISNASGTVTYSWVNASNVVVGTTATVTGLPAGTYTLTVKDNCTTLTCTQIISQPSLMTMGACSHTDVSCHSSCNNSGSRSGSVKAGVISNASGTVTYIWRNSSNQIVGYTSTVNNLPAGTYTLTVKDNCSTLTCTQTIGQPSLMTMGACSSTNIVCGNGSTTGSVTAGTVLNASGTIRYEWRNSSNTIVGTSATVTGLPAGTYKLTVKDDCTSLTCTRTITRTSNLAMTACSHTNLLCHSSCYNVSNNTGSVTAGIVTGASGNVSYSWRNTSNTVVGTTATVNGLPAGTYTLTVKDNCSSVTCSQTITQPAAAMSMGNCSHTDITTVNGRGSVKAGTIYNASGTVTYKWKNSFNQVVGTTAIVTGLTAGKYYLTVTDNCSTVTCCETIKPYSRYNSCEGDGYSRGVSVSSLQNTVSEVSASPNPFSDKVLVTTIQNQAGIMRASLMSSNGIVVKNFVLNVQKGKSTHTLNGLANLAQGTYLIRLQSAEISETLKLIKR